MWHFLRFIKKPATLIALAVSTPLVLWLLWGLIGVQWFAARWTKDEVDKFGPAGDLFGGINALFTALAMTGAGIAAYFQYRTFKLTREQFAAVQRPWLSCELSLPPADEYAALPIQTDQGVVQVTVKVKIENVGAAPALNVWPHLRLARADDHPKTLEERQRQVCTEANAQGAHRDGLALFPGQSRDLIITVSVQKDSLKQDNMFKDPPMIIVALIGCVGYASAHYDSRHQTRFAYQPFASEGVRADGASIEIGGGLLPLQSTPLRRDRLGLFAMITHGNFFTAD